MCIHLIHNLSFAQMGPFRSPEIGNEYDVWNFYFPNLFFIWNNFKLRILFFLNFFYFVLYFNRHRTFVLDFLFSFTKLFLQTFSLKWFSFVSFFVSKIKWTRRDLNPRPPTLFDLSKSRCSSSSVCKAGALPGWATGPSPNEFVNINPIPAFAEVDLSSS